MATADTIVALASGALPSAIAVVRISGQRAFPIVAKFVGSLPPDRVLAVRVVRDPVTSAPIDEAMVVCFPGPNSFTGEDCVEIHLHGSKAVVSHILAAFTDTDEVARIAEPGEFTRRAFEAGRLDMAQVEGLSDLIDADTESQRTLALARYEGFLSRVVLGWRSQLIRLLSYSEAWLDFSDEEDVGEVDLSRCNAVLVGLRQEMQKAIEGFGGGRIIREGFRVALIGAPNAGKSSVLNMLANSEVAIVTSEAGTTRDLREIEIDLGGRKVVVIDSAGLRASSSAAEREGVRRALEVQETCDLIIEVVSVDTQQDFATIERGPTVVRLGNKSDLGAPIGCDALVSCVENHGFPRLFQLISNHMDGILPAGRGVLLTRSRDRQAVVAACDDILAAIGQTTLAPASFFGELFSEDLRSAVQSLERLLGRVDAEDILDELFSGFCIGK